jgi:hypothetical protein
MTICDCGNLTEDNNQFCYWCMDAEKELSELTIVEMRPVTAEEEEKENNW